MRYFQSFFQLCPVFPSFFSWSITQFYAVPSLVAPTCLNLRFVLGKNGVFFKKWWGFRDTFRKVFCDIKNFFEEFPERYLLDFTWYSGSLKGRPTPDLRKVVGPSNIYKTLKLSLPPNIRSSPAPSTPTTTPHPLPRCSPSSGHWENVLQTRLPSGILQSSRRAPAGLPQGVPYFKPSQRWPQRYPPKRKVRHVVSSAPFWYRRVCFDSTKLFFFF